MYNYKCINMNSKEEVAKNDSDWYQDGILPGLETKTWY